LLGLSTKPILYPAPLILTINMSVNVEFINKT
jgi:hypothetical protein